MTNQKPDDSSRIDSSMSRLFNHKSSTKPGITDNKVKQEVGHNEGQAIGKIIDSQVFNIVINLPKKISLLFGGSIAAALALALTFSFLPETSTLQHQGIDNSSVINSKVLLRKAIFYFNYKFNPEPGLRKWYQLNDNRTWIEEYPSGHKTKFVVVDETKKDNIPGVIVRKIDGNKEKTGVSDFDIEVFIPDRESNSQSLYFRHKEHDEEWQDWKRLGEITYY